MTQYPIIPSASTDANAPAPDQAESPHPSPLARMSWARLLKRVFDIDLDKPDTWMYRCQLLRTEHCPNCGGPLTIIAAILDPTAKARPRGSYERQSKTGRGRRRPCLARRGCIAKILSHLGLSARAPPRSPARHFALLQTA